MSKKNYDYDIFFQANRNKGKIETCRVTGQKFNSTEPFAFYVNKDTRWPVTAEVALENGFRMVESDYLFLQKTLRRVEKNVIKGKGKKSVAA